MSENTWLIFFAVYSCEQLGGQQTSLYSTRMWKFWIKLFAYKEMPNEFPFIVPFNYSRSNFQNANLKKRNSSEQHLGSLFSMGKQQRCKNNNNKKKSNHKTHNKKVSFYKTCHCLSAFITLELYKLNLNFYKNRPVLAMQVRSPIKEQINNTKRQ